MRRSWRVAPFLIAAMVLTTTPPSVAGLTGCGDACAPGDTVIQVWVPTVTAAVGARVSVRVRVDLGTDELALSGAEGALRFDPALLAFDGVALVTEGEEPRVDSSLATVGVLSFEVEGPPSTSVLDRGTLLDLWFRVVGSPGLQAGVLIQVQALTVAPGVDALAWTTVRHGAVHIH